MRVFSQINNCQQKKKQKTKQNKQTNKQTNKTKLEGAPLLGLAKSIYYILSQTKLLENHTLNNGAHLYRLLMEVPPGG